MLTEICQYLHNWFDRKPDGTSYAKYTGEFNIVGGQLVLEGLAGGQYFRILGSLFNDGVHEFSPADVLTDETFTGSVWALGIPPAVVALASEIEQWQAMYGSVTSEAMSPYQSESFAGYSYSKSGGGSADASSGTQSGTWQSAFASRLSPWRKI